MTTFDLSKVPIDQVFEKMGLSEKKMTRHLKGSLKQTATWTKTHMLKYVSKKTRIPQKMLRPRINARLRGNGFSARATYYVTPFNLIRFEAEQDSEGVTTKIRSKKSHYKSAFIRVMPDKERPIVVKRTGVQRVMIKGRYKGKRREAIAPVGIALREHVERGIKVVIEKDVAATFWKKMKQRLNWISKT